MFFRACASESGAARPQRVFPGSCTPNKVFVSDDATASRHWNEESPLTPPSSQGGPLQLTINRAAAPRRRARRALIYGGWLAGDVLPRAFGATTEPRKEGPPLPAGADSCSACALANIRALAARRQTGGAPDEPPFTPSIGGLGSMSFGAGRLTALERTRHYLHRKLPKERAGNQKHTFRTKKRR